MLEKLGFKKRTHVGISLSANNFIELVCVDKASKSVVKYSSGNIKYNNAIREIIDFDEFAEVVEGLFEDAGLNPKECSVTLNLPNVHFGITSLDNVSETPFIVENLQSEIEDLYIFKRNEPIISYSILDSAYGRDKKNIVYSAIQTKVIVKIIEIFDNMEAELVRIDSSYSSMLKSIQFCDRFNKYVQKEEKTAILLITPNSCCSFYLNGPTLIDCIEEPLAVKSFSTEEVYSAISKIATNTISKNSPQSFLIISETDEVNSELLSQKLDFQGEIDYINKSINTNEQFIDISSVSPDIDSNMISYMTIEAVGAAVADYDEYPLNINFLPPERINENLIEVGEYEVDLYRFITVIIITAVLAAAIVCLAASLFFTSRINSIQGQNYSAEKEIEVFKKTISTNEKNQKKDIIPILTKILETNKTVFDVYSALSTEIPDSIYIKKFVTNADGGIGILGEATTSESVQDFVKGLREKNSDLMLSKLSINSKEDPVPAKIPNGFTFEIKTSKIDVSLTDDDFLHNVMPNNQMPNQINPNTMQTQQRNRRGPAPMTPPPSPII